MSTRTRSVSLNRRARKEPVAASEATVRKSPDSCTRREPLVEPTAIAQSQKEESQNSTKVSDQDGATSEGTPRETASLSEVAVRYSLTPSASGTQPELEGVQINIEPDPLGVDSRYTPRAAEMGDNGASESRALVPAASLALPDTRHLAPHSRHEGYSSSEDSTNVSPRSAGEQAQQMSILRTGCATDSSDAASSIAVDCHTGPSEVIVRGKNVRKIHVKFPPHPPSEEGQSMSYHSIEKPPKSGGRHRRSTSLNRTSGAQPQEHGDESAAASDEQPLTTARRTMRNLSLNSTSILPGISGMRTGNMHEQPSPGLRDSGVSNISFDMHMSASTEMEQKIKHDIINGIAYFEQKNAELRHMNNCLVAELERVKRLNNQLEDRLKMSSDRNREISSDNDELKIKLDSRERENERLKEQAVSHWDARRKSEELYMELKRDTDIEIRSLREQLSNKEKEVARVISSAAQKEKSLRSLKEPGLASKSLRANMEDHLELLHKIARLEEEISKLRTDSDREKSSSKRTRDEADSLRTKMKEQTTELESHHKRFLSLKKSFNDMRDENEKLKMQLRGRRASMNPNNTWPKNTDSASSKPAENEAVSYFDIPSKLAKSSSPSGKKLTAAFAKEHKRTSSDARSTYSDNLPPVSTTQK